MHSPLRLNFSSSAAFPSSFSWDFASAPAKSLLQTCNQDSGFSHLGTSKPWIPSKRFGIMSLPSYQSLVPHSCKNSGFGTFGIVLCPQLRLCHLKKNLLFRVSAGESNNRSDGRQGHEEHIKEDIGQKKKSSVNGGNTGYIWLLAPSLITAAIIIPTYTIPLVDLLQRSYLSGLGMAFGIDLLFVFSADAFFVLTHNAGQHQQIAGGPPPWIGPWEYTGYPNGLPRFWHNVVYAGVAIALVSSVLSLFVGKLLVALVVFGPYLALILAQVAYERILSSDRLPTYPLVPIIYTLYRFWQLARGLKIVSCLRGGNFLASALRLLIAVWTFYLAMHLTHLPWLYSTWNANRIV